VRTWAAQGWCWCCCWGSCLRGKLVLPGKAWQRARRRRPKALARHFRSIRAGRRRRPRMSDCRGRRRALGCRVWPDEQGRWPDATRQVTAINERGGRAERAAGGREDARRTGTCWRESLPQQARAPASSTAHECSAPAHTDRKEAVAAGCAAGTGLAACESKSGTGARLDTGCMLGGARACGQYGKAGWRRGIR
jgi:hypothetical protein